MIDALEKGDRYQHIEPLLKSAEDGELLIVCSAWVMAETAKVKGKSQEESEKLIHDMWENDYFHCEAVHDRIAGLAGRLVAKHGITPKDAVHVATALLLKCPVLLTNDGEGGKRKSLLPLDRKIAHDGHTLRIMTPGDYCKIRYDKDHPLFTHMEGEEDEGREED